VTLRNANGHIGGREKIGPCPGAKVREVRVERCTDVFMPLHAICLEK